ncbi:beta-lactamase family protein [Kribbella qitaiheensis]|uniref:Beta-lactamase family protein n=1 Tax=Kribbella qitaiheensis TaxID=1544730 RepID=A0A7G6WW62_9ACTN|nr:serine hydrolase domain-containing protein [Kribbella qitaiheensis]QNE18227.1 beta-lactamase family protein [Kribbella qitaiheensis]
MFSVDRVEELLEAGYRSRVYPGAVWSVGDTDWTSVGGSVGVVDPTQPDQPMLPDTVFDVASLTKVLTVWASIGVQATAGELRLPSRLDSFWPEAEGHPVGQATVHQLLTHTAGLPLRANLKNLYGTSPSAVRGSVLAEALQRPPGQMVEYTVIWTTGPSSLSATRLGPARPHAGAGGEA